jgi:shikimate dehydrogenase
MRIDGNTEILAHIGWPTYSFKAPLIYNPYFEQAGIPAMVVPMGCKEAGFPALLQSLFALENIRGALITMPHKVAVMPLLDEVSPMARVAGACNAVKRLANGRLHGDMFDGEGFVRGVKRKGFAPAGRRGLVVGSGGVGSAIAASLAAAGIGSLSLFDANQVSAQALAGRIREHYPQVDVQTGNLDPAGHDLVVNATPLGMSPGDPLPVDTQRIEPTAFVGEVVMAQEMTPFLAAAQARGCRIQIGKDMLFEQIPAYLEYFGFPTTTAEHLRAVALA